LKDFRKNIIDELDNLKENNPSKYWTLLNDLSIGTMKPFAQDEGKELVDKTKLNVLLKLFNRNDWLI
jgi:hypothetical protein